MSFKLAHLSPHDSTFSAKLTLDIFPGAPPSLPAFSDSSSPAFDLPTLPMFSWKLRISKLLPFLPV